MWLKTTILPSLETSIAPENQWLEDEFSFWGRAYFQGAISCQFQQLYGSPAFWIMRIYHPTAPLATSGDFGERWPMAFQFTKRDWRFWSNTYGLPSLKLTASLHPKIDGWKLEVGRRTFPFGSFWDVSFREGTWALEFLLTPFSKNLGSGKWMNMALFLGGLKPYIFKGLSCLSFPWFCEEEYLQYLNISEYHRNISE